MKIQWLTRMRHGFEMLEHEWDIAEGSEHTLTVASQWEFPRTNVDLSKTSEGWVVTVRGSDSTLLGEIFIGKDEWYETVEEHVP